MAPVNSNQLGTGKQIPTRVGVIWLGLFPNITLLCRLQGPRMGARGLGSYQDTPLKQFMIHHGLLAIGAYHMVFS